MILNANNNQYIIREDKKMSMSKACRKQIWTFKALL